ncbi:MAG: hypothetical protein HKN92_04285 [Chitinophagales bacterium]|nr:hypothetical protein [Chitinophagales bacterium]
METSEVKCRKATRDDIPFIVETIIQAERSGTNMISYQKVFNLSDDQLREFLMHMLNDETPHHDFTFTSYYLAEYQGRIVGALAGFIEEGDEIPSKIIKGNLMAKHFGIEAWKNAADKLRLLSSIEIDRTPGTLQLEYGFVLPGLKAKGVMSSLHSFIMKEMKLKYPKLKIAECQTSIDNEALKKLYRFGWVDFKTVNAESDEILKYASSKHRIARRYFFDQDAYKLKS